MWQLQPGILSRAAFDAAGAGSVATTTFDGTIVNVTVSPDKLTVTHGNTTNSVGVSSATFLTAGKFYFEITATLSTFGTNGAGVILSPPNYSTNTAIMSGILTNAANVPVWSNGVNTGKNLGAFVSGDRFGCAIDLTARLAWFRRNGGNWNNDGAANPATGTGGVAMAASGSYAPFVKFTSTGTTDNMTGNFGQTAFVDAAPAGFGYWA